MGVVWIAAEQGDLLGSDRSAVDLIGEASAQGAVWVAIPLARLDPDFFKLATGVAGGFLQKFVTSGMGVAIVGDISVQTGGSEALAAFVRESNAGRAAWFVEDLVALDDRLSAKAAEG